MKRKEMYCVVVSAEGTVYFYNWRTSFRPCLH